MRFRSSSLDSRAHGGPVRSGTSTNLLFLVFGELKGTSISGCLNQSQRQLEAVYVVLHDYSLDRYVLIFPSLDFNNGS